MINHKDNPAEIYLVAMLGEDHDHIWSDTPAPGEGMKEEDATRYIRADLVPESNAGLAERIADLTRQNSGLESLAKHRSESINSLMAQVEQLRKAIIDSTNNGAETDGGRWVCSIDISVLDKTKAQCLADYSRQVCTEFFYWWHNQPGSNTKQGFDDWWNLRQQAKGGCDGL